MTNLVANRLGMICVAAIAACGVASTTAHAAVTGPATLSTTVETSGPYGTSSFEASGNTANTYPGYGVVGFDVMPFLSLASTGVSPSVTINATEYNSTSTATQTSAGSVVDFYFAKSPATGAALGTYDTTNTPGGFNAATFDADYVGSFTYQQVANQLDTITLTLTPADVAYVNNVLTQGAGTLEFFAVATTPGGAGRWDGTYASATATLSLDAASGTAVPEPASLGLLALGGAALTTRRRRTA